MRHRQERVRIETPHHHITGTLTLSAEGYRSRIIDVLNAAERDFVALTDVTVRPRDGSEPASEHPFIAVHRGQIVVVLPLGTAAAEAAEAEAAAADAA